MPARSSSSARLFAPAALAVCAVALLVVIGGSLGGDDSSDGGGSGSGAAETAATETTGSATTAQPRPQASYTIEAGDTLGAIAEQTGVPVETLQELNPELDPQALIAGQKIKLRE